MDGFFMVSDSLIGLILSSRDSSTGLRVDGGCAIVMQSLITLDRIFYNGFNTTYFLDEIISLSFQTQRKSVFYWFLNLIESWLMPSMTMTVADITYPESLDNTARSKFGYYTIDKQLFQLSICENII